MAADIAREVEVGSEEAARTTKYYFTKIHNQLYSYYALFLFRYAVHTLIQTIIFDSQNV